MCLVANVCSHLFLRTTLEDIPEPSTKARLFEMKIKDIIYRVIESLKNPSGPNVNPHNRCVWKICSKPLKKYRSESYKDVTIYKQNSQELIDLIKSLNVVY